MYLFFSFRFGPLLDTRTTDGKPTDIFQAASPLDLGLGGHWTVRSFDVTRKHNNRKFVNVEKIQIPRK